MEHDRAIVRCVVQSRITDAPCPEPGLVGWCRLGPTLRRRRRRLGLAGPRPADGFLDLESDDQGDGESSGAGYVARCDSSGERSSPTDRLDAALRYKNSIAALGNLSAAPEVYRGRPSRRNR